MVAVAGRRGVVEHRIALDFWWFYGATPDYWSIIEGLCQ